MVGDSGATAGAEAAIGIVGAGWGNDGAAVGSVVSTSKASSKESGVAATAGAGAVFPPTGAAAGERPKASSKAAEGGTEVLGIGMVISFDLFRACVNDESPKSNVSSKLSNLKDCSAVAAAVGC